METVNVIVGSDNGSNQSSDWLHQNPFVDGNKGLPPSDDLSQFQICHLDMEVDEEDNPPPPLLGSPDIVW